MVTIDDTEPIARPARGRRVALRVVVVGLLAVFSACGLAVEGALSAPGDDPAAAKLAEWGRDNGLGGLCTISALRSGRHPGVPSISTWGAG